MNCDFKSMTEIEISITIITIIFIHNSNSKYLKKNAILSLVLSEWIKFFEHSFEVCFWAKVTEI